MLNDDRLAHEQITVEADVLLRVIEEEARGFCYGTEAQGLIDAGADHLASRVLSRLRALSHEQYPESSTSQ